MGDGKKKSIWKKYDKSKGDYKRDDNDKLYYRINRKTGRIETNLLEWERSWKNMKILKYPTGRESSTYSREHTGSESHPTRRRHRQGALDPHSRTDRRD